MFVPSTSRISVLTVWKSSGEGYSVLSSWTSEEDYLLSIWSAPMTKGKILTLKVLKLISPVPAPPTSQLQSSHMYRRNIPFHSARSISGGQLSAPFSQNAGQVPLPTVA